MEYYKLIIADDERMIRKGLVNNIKWNDMGFEVVGDFIDGEDVIAWLKEQNADVVFTDVSMCQVSGLAVARWVRENKPWIRVVIISGYKEFEYVKEAIQVGAVDYILKPVKPQEIEKVFRKLKEELDQEKRKKDKNVNALFSYRDDVECAKVLEIEDGLIETVVSGNSEKSENVYQSWNTAIHKVLWEYVPLLILHAIDELYDRIDRSGIHLSEDLEKDASYRKISSVWGEELIEKAGEIICDIAADIESRKSTLAENVIVKAREYIDKHLAENFGVEDLAAYVFLNRSYFSREFKNETGVSVTDYIIPRRMEKAAELIRLGELPTEKVAEMVGYTDVKYFQRSFKKYTGCTIREYRNLLRKE